MSAVEAGFAPNVTLVELGDLRTAAGELLAEGVPSLQPVLALEVPVDDDHRLGPDQRWYWAAPLLLDRGRADAEAL